MEGTYGRRGGSSRRYNHGEYQIRGRGSRRGRGGNRRDYADHERASYHDNRDCLDSRDTYKNDDEGFRPRGRGGGRGRHPAGLKGKEIGLFYARMGKEKAKKKDIANRATIDIDSHRERHLSNLLADIRAQDTVRPQPSRSYRDAFENEEEDDDATFKMGSHTEAYGSVPKAKRNHSVPDSWDDAEVSPDEEGAKAEVKEEKKSPFERKERPASSSSDSTRSAHSSQTVHLQQVRRHIRPGTQDLGAYFIDTTPSYEQDNDSDTETGEPERLTLGESPEDLAYYQEDIEESEVDKYAPALTEMYKAEEQDSDFVIEFMKHNRANRRSNERLNDVRQHDYSLPRNAQLDTKLKEELEKKQQNSRQVQKMLEFRKKLPSYQMREEILKTVKSSQVVVLSGETGCGKTTQVSQFILDDCIERGDGSLCRIVCTQPRRISAISVAERVADERGERCGEGNSVGYQIRLEKKMPRNQGSILYCTTGIMLQWLASDPCLAQTSHIILDEIHERDLHSDFLMIILKDVIKKRSDLKVILMSATLNAEMFSKYYGGCPMMNIPGFTYPVTEHLLEDVIEMTEYKHNQPNDFPPRKRVRYGRNKQQQLEEEANHEAFVRNLPDKYSRQTKDVLCNMDFKDIDLDLVVHLVRHICQKKGDGAILIFLPGWEQISKVNNYLKDSGLGNERFFRLIPLHSMLPTVNQKEVFERPPPGVRKIVIATNIAETSITIDDVVFVIDCGKIKMKNFDAEHNISTLAPEWVSLANARQRRGRAGRVQPGECYHLYTKYQESQLESYQLPEMLRTRLEELCLQIKLLKLGMVMPFIQKAMEPPSLEAIEVSIQMLKDLSAFDDSEDLTPLGYHLAKMPVDPHTGKMLLFAAMFSCLDPVLTVAASLSFKDAFYIPMGKEKEADRRRCDLAEGTVSDHLMLANAFSGWERAVSRGTSGQYCYGNFMSQSTLRMLSNMRKQFTTLLHQMKFVDSDNPKASLANKHSTNKKLIKACITAGLYPNVAKLVRPKKGRKDATLMTKTERRVNIHPKSVNANEENFPSQWFIYHLKMKTARIYLYDCTCITPYPLLFFGGKMKFQRDNDQDCLVMDDWMYFRASQRIAHLVKELRVELDKLLEYKITHPGVTNWNPKDKEGALMRAILDLITTAEH